MGKPLMPRCPYGDCTYEADTQEEVDEHVTYCISLNDADHAAEKHR
jgi:hypothetical protein